MRMAWDPMRRQHERCREVRAQMSNYLDGELERREASGVKRHTLWCPNCRHMLRNLRRTIEGLGRLRDVPVSSDEPPASV